MPRKEHGLLTPEEENMVLKSALFSIQLALESDSIASTCTGKLIDITHSMKCIRYLLPTSTTQKTNDWKLIKALKKYFSKPICKFDKKANRKLGFRL